MVEKHTELFAQYLRRYDEVGDVDVDNVEPPDASFKDLRPMVDRPKGDIENARPLSNVDVGLICALPETELAEIHRVFPGLSIRSEGGSEVTFFDGMIETDDNDEDINPEGKTMISVAAACQIEMGMVAASFTTSEMIRIYRPRTIILTGICAGYRRASTLGDLVVPSKVFDYGSGKLRNGKFLPDPRQVGPSDKALQYLRFGLGQEKVRDRLLQPYRSSAKSYGMKSKLPDLDGFQIRTDAMGSGSAVVVDPTVLDGVAEADRKLCAIDMEAYGFMRTARALAPSSDYVVMKAVSDYADEEKNDDIQSYCSFVSARYAREYIVRKLVQKRQAVPGPRTA